MERDQRAEERAQQERDAEAARQAEAERDAEAARQAEAERERQDAEADQRLRDEFAQALEELAQEMEQQRQEEEEELERQRLEQEEAASLGAIDVGEVLVPLPVAFKRKQLRFVLANAKRPRREPEQEVAVPVLPETVVLLLDEAQQNNFVTDWGRCCVAGTLSVAGHSMLSKQRCYLDPRSVSFLNFTMLDAQHLSVVRSVPHTLVKFELLVFVS